MKRFPEAEGIYRLAIEELKDQGDLDSAARILASLGSAELAANRVEYAEMLALERGTECFRTRASSCRIRERAQGPCGSQKPSGGSARRPIPLFFRH